MDEHLRSRRAVLAGGAALGLGAFGVSSALADEHEDDEMPAQPEDVTTDPSTDADVLNYALTLERLEARFYEEQLDEFSEDEIQDAEVLDGFDDRVLDDVVTQLEITKEHEQIHEEVLIDIIELLGGEPADEPEFEFDIDDADEFLETAAVLENTGVSAYNGAISLIQSPDLQTASASIATVEGRHASYLNALVGDDPFPAAFDEARSMDEVLEIAGGFIADEEEVEDELDEDDDDDDDVDDDDGVDDDDELDDDDDDVDDDDDYDDDDDDDYDDDDDVDDDDEVDDDDDDVDDDDDYDDDDDDDYDDDDDDDDYDDDDDDVLDDDDDDDDDD